MWDWVGDRAFHSYAQLRPYVGDFYEEATKVWLAARRMQTQANCLCPDLVIDGPVYFESKSVGTSNASLLYDHRVEKYDQFMAAGHRLYYVFWRHACAAASIRTLFELRRQLSVQTWAVMIVSGEEVHREFWKLKHFNTSYRGTTANAKTRTLAPGRTLHAGLLRKWMAGQSRMAWVGSVYGCSIPMVPAYGSNFDG
jgi:hypothetical protein